MPFTNQQTEFITAALNRKAPSAACPMCLHPNLTLVDQIVTLQLQPDPNRFKIGGSALPCVATVCRECGYTALFNVYVLGVAGELGMSPQTEEQQNG